MGGDQCNPSDAARAAVKEALETMMDSIADMILDDPRYPESKKEPLRVLRKYRTLKASLDDKLLKLADPELPVTDDLRLARREVAQLLQSMADNCNDLIHKYPKVFDEI